MGMHDRTKVAILITRVRGGVAQTEERRFDDVHRAANWLVEDSYFMNSDVKTFTWVRVGEN